MNKKKILSFALAAVLTVSAIPSSQLDAKSTPKLKSASVTLKIGETYQNKLKNTKVKVMWKSQDKKIATVSSKGLVKGISVGKTKVTATAKKKTYTCSVEVENTVKDVAKTPIPAPSVTPTPEPTEASIPEPTATPEPTPIAIPYVPQVEKQNLWDNTVVLYPDKIYDFMDYYISITGYSFKQFGYGTTDTYCLDINFTSNTNNYFIGYALFFNSKGEKLNKKDSEGIFVAKDGKGEVWVEYAKETAYIVFTEKNLEPSAVQNITELGYRIDSSIEYPVSTPTPELSITPSPTPKITPEPTPTATPYVFNITYIGNIKTKVFHKSTCGSVKLMNPSSKVFLSSRANAISQGYTVCHKCNP